MVQELLNTCPGNQGIAGVFFTQLLGWLLQSQCKLGNSQIYPKDQDPWTEYDFIVVGAGSAGSVVASRLSEISNWNVLLIEAGGDTTATTDVPAFVSLYEKDLLDWQYTTEPEPGICQGFVGKTCHFSRGKGLGGSSLINFLIYVRGNKLDYDNWQALGNPGWSYKDVLQYFKKSQDMRMPEFSSSDYHGTGGYLGLEKGLDPVFQYATDMILNAAKELGLPTNHDLNGEQQLGFSELPGFICDGTRCNTAKAFLSPAKDRPNLHVMKNAFVKKLLIDDDKRTVGVEVAKNGKEFTIRTRKEVVLSAGAINSPQILMLSGVGPKEHLEDLQIPLIKNLKVGEHLEDHFLLLGISVAIKPFDNDSNKPPTHVLDELYKYLTTFTGGLSKLNTIHLIGFIDSTGQNSVWPDLEIYNMYFPANESMGLSAFLAKMQYDEEHVTTLMEANKNYDILLLCPSLLRPEGAGKILLKDKDPYNYPKIYSGYMKAQYDRDTMLKGVRFIERLVETDPFKNRDSFIIDYKYQNCREKTFRSDDYWICVMQQIGMTNYHQTGTCKMGPISDPNAVVDSRLRVHGIDSLRVVDASIMPKIPSGNTNAPTIMIAEKASDLIKEDWERKLKDEF